MTLDAFASPQVLQQNHGSLAPSGAEWLIDAAGCAPDRLTNLAAMQQLCDIIIEQARLHVVGEPIWHQFNEPGGVTGLYLLSESHLTCHTFPEFGLAAFNLYCCRPRQSFDWKLLLRDHLCASRVSIREVERGLIHGGTA